MLFRTFEPYYDNNIVNNKKTIDNEECFICFQFLIDNEVKPIQLQEQLCYTKKCNCNGWVHKICLDRWVDNTSSCPICRNKIIKHNYNNFQIHIIKIYNHINQHFYKLNDFILFIFFLYFVKEFYTFIIFVIHEKQKQNRI